MTRRARTGAWAVAAVLLAPLAPRAAGSRETNPTSITSQPARRRTPSVPTTPSSRRARTPFPKRKTRPSSRRRPRRARFAAEGRPSAGGGGPGRDRGVPGAGRLEPSAVESHGSSTFTIRSLDRDVVRAGARPRRLRGGARRLGRRRGLVADGRAPDCRDRGLGQRSPHGPHRGALRRPFHSKNPAIGATSGTNSIGVGKYDALQASVRQRQTEGLEFLASTPGARR